MIVFLKNPTTGEFEQSGFFPPDCRAMIATDVNKPTGDYTLDDAVALVKECIAKKRKYYRYEIHPTTASQLKHKPKAIKVKATTVKKAESARPAKPQAAPKQKLARKAKKKETGAQRRARLKAAGLCTACGKRKAEKGFCECPACRKYYRAWAANQAAK